MPSLKQILENNKFIITDGGIETRVIYEKNLSLPEHIEVAGLIYDQHGREVLKEIYNSYLDGQKYNLPIIIGTPTFHANPHQVNKSNLNLDDVIMQCVHLHQELRQKRGDYQKNILIAGVIGPKNDAFNPTQALAPKEAQNYHVQQIEAFKKTAIDFLFAPTFPAVSEALGTCKAMAASGLDYVISFVLNQNSLILDGHTLDEAIQTIDAQTNPKPLFYSLSCIHPIVAIKALEKLQAKDRLLELKANASRKSTQELIALNQLDQGNPEEFGKQMAQIHHDFSLKVLGGCCGTDQNHIEAIAKYLSVN